MTNEEQRKEDLERLKQHTQQLSEHFDTVQIFVTRHMPAELNGTRVVNYGSGNWYARYGQVSLWLTEHEECERLNVRKEDEEQT